MKEVNEAIQQVLKVQAVTMHEHTTQRQNDYVQLNQNRPIQDDKQSVTFKDIYHIVNEIVSNQRPQYRQQTPRFYRPPNQWNQNRGQQNYQGRGRGNYGNNYNNQPAYQNNYQNRDQRNNQRQNQNPNQQYQNQRYNPNNPRYNQNKTRFCDYCRNNGHTKAYCRKKQADEEQKNRKQGEVTDQVVRQLEFEDIDSEEEEEMYYDEENLN